MKNSFNYLCIGDSIGEGFNSKFGTKTCGYKDCNGPLVKGYSWSDYFVQYLIDLASKNNAQDFINNLSYTNASLCAMTSIDLYSILKNNFSYEVSFLIRKENEIDAYGNYPLEEKSFWFSKSFDKNNFLKLRTKLILAIQNADLIALNVAGNDLQQNFPMDKIKDFVVEKNYFKKVQLKNTLIESIHDAFKKTEDNYVKAIEAVKEINPKAKIIVVSYIPPFIDFMIHLEKVALKINKALYRDFFKNISKSIMDLTFNSALRTNTIYSITYKHKIWDRHSTNFSENIIDCHPTEKGYEEMARRFFLSCLKNNLLPITSSSSYINKIDRFCTIRNNKNILKTNKNVSLAFDLPSKENKLIYLFRTWLSDNNIKANPYFLVIANMLKNVLNRDGNNSLDEIRNQSNNSSLVDVLVQLLKYIIGNLKETSKTKKQMIEIINNKTLLENICIFFLSCKPVENIINNIESLYWKKSKLLFKLISKSRKNWSKVWNKILKNNENNIFNLFKELIANKDINLKNIISQLLANFKDDLVNDNLLQSQDLFMNFLVSLIGHGLSIFQIIDEFFAKAIDFINRIESFESFTVLAQEFVKSNANSVKKFITYLCNNISWYIETNPTNASRLILFFLNISENTLNTKEWKKLSKIMTLISSCCSSAKNVEVLANFIEKSLRKIKYWSLLDFSRISLLNLFKLYVKVSGPNIFAALFNFKFKDWNKLMTKVYFFKSNHSLRTLLGRVL